MPTNNHSSTFGYNQDVDPSSWRGDVASGPDPAPMVQTENGMVRDVTPDPYADDNPNVLRNFGAR